MGEHEERMAEPFGWLRCTVAVVTGGVGMVLGAWLALFGGGALDDALGTPLGEDSGFLSFGHLTIICVVLGTALGAVYGALGGHGLLRGRGSVRVGLGAVVLGLVLVVLVSLPGRGLVFPALLLLPVAAAVGLELSNGPREVEGPRVGPRRSTRGNPR